MMLVGKVCSTVCCTVLCRWWRRRDSRLACSATPAPGWTRFAAPSPITSASVVTISKYRIAFPPIRPMVLMLPVPAIPTTKVAKMSGAMIDLIRRRKMVPNRPSSFAGPGNAAPNATPATSAIRIQAVSDDASLSRFTSRPI